MRTSTGGGAGGSALGGFSGFGSPAKPARPTPEELQAQQIAEQREKVRV